MLLKYAIKLINFIDVICADVVIKNKKQNKNKQAIKQTYKQAKTKQQKKTKHAIVYY